MRVGFNAFGWAAGSLAVMVLAGPSPNALAPTAGHVVFPQRYLDNYQVLCRFDKTGKKEW
jgi:hypothetical protein